MNPVSFRRFLASAIFFLVIFSLAVAEEGKIRVNVTPEEAYIFVDGQPFVHRSNTLTLSTGDHTIGVYNYGYVPQVQKVYIEKGSNPAINARLTRVPETVSGPWGRIQIEGVHGDTLVFLNGTAPEFFVGHADEFNNHILNRQQLIVPVGTHQLYLMDHKTGKMLWSGPLEVKANERLLLYANRGQNGETVYKHWSDGMKTASLKRFEAGTATATVAVAPIAGKLLVDRQEIKCGEPVKLTWSSADGANTTVMANNAVLANTPTGELAVTPKQTTTYEFRTAGPGGTATSSATVRVDNTIQTSLTPDAKELRFVKVGDKIVEQGSTTLNWTASNADAVHIEPIGLVTGTSGSETVTAVPAKTEEGTVDEMKTFKITATNGCGGSDTSIASVHVTGSIEPEQVAEMKEPELPQTASPFPLLALFGLASLGSGLIVRLIRRG
jgi:PEGA domain-containing protein